MNPIIDSEKDAQTAVPDSFSSTVKLQVDGKSGHLGAPKEITSTTPRAALRDFADLGIRGTITHLEHGTYDSQPAALIALKSLFLFDSTSGTGRFTKAEIRVAFDALKDPTKTKEQKKASSPSPKVMRFCPVLIQGRSTRVAISNSVEAKIDASLTPAVASIAGVGLSGGYSVTHHFDRDYEMMIKGIPWSIADHDSDNEVDNAVIWKITENAAIGKGIPDEFNFAILVQHNGGPFQATVEIKVWTKAGVRLFGWPWPKPDPLNFRPSASLGRQLGLRTFDELEDDHWERLAPYEGSLHVSLLHNRFDCSASLISSDSATN